MRALALLVLLAAGPASAVPTPEAATRKALGDTRRDAGDNSGALAAYREASQISPDYIEAWEEIGKLYFEAKKFNEATEAFQRAVDVDASFANNWFNLALASRRSGDPSRARDALRRYLALKPEDTEARLRLADVLRQLGERDPAIKEYQAVVDAAEARTVAPALGERAKEAIAQLRAGLATPTSPAAVAPPAPAAGAQQGPAVAVAAVPPVAATPPVTPPPVIQPPAPVPTPRPLVEPAAPPSPALLDKLALGDRLQAAGDFRGALFAYQDAVYLDPRHALARVKLGRSYWVLRYVGQAEEQWLLAAQLAPSDPSIAHMIEEARKAPRPALSTPEPAAGTPAGGGAPAAGPGTGAVSGGGEPGNGARVYKFVPESAPAQPAPAAPAGGSTPGYGMPSAQPQGYPQPQPQYAQPQYQPPQQQQYQQQYAQPQYAPPQYAQPQYAQPQYAQPQYVQPQYAQPSGAQPGYAQPGYAQPQYGQPAPAQPAHPQPGLSSEPAAPMVPASVGAAAQRYRTALSLYTQRDYLGAVAELDAAITLDPNLAVAYVARGSARFGLGKYRQAAADYKAALDLDPARAEPIWGLAECQRMLHDPAAPDTYRRYAASVAGDVNEDRRARARKWATELSPPQPIR